MTYARALLAMFLIFGLAEGISPACAQSQSATAGEIEEWWEDLLLEGGDEGKRAAFELFFRQIEPERMLEVMGGTNTKAKVGLLEALKMAGRTHPESAFKLAMRGLGDADDELHLLAVRALGLLETPSTYAQIGVEIRRLRDARSDTRDGKVALGLIDAIGRMRRPMRAAGVLIDILSQRMTPPLEQRVRRVLENLTAQNFASPSQWSTWWEETRRRGLEPNEWRVEVVQRRAEAVRQLRAAAEDYFGRTLTSLQATPKALLQELARGLKETRIPGIPRRAVTELAQLGRLHEGATPEQQAVRAEAVQILAARLREGGGADFDPLEVDLIRALGRTGDATLLPELSRFLVHDNLLMRLAAVGALADLRDRKAIPDLLRQLSPEQDPELIGAALEALGQIGEDVEITPGPPPFRVSDRLTQFCEGVLASNGEAGPAAPGHLAAAAWSLGALRRSQPPSPKEVELLGRLAAHADPNVRFKAVGSLGTLASEGAFGLLEARLSVEPAIHVRKAILNAIGRQALGNLSLLQRAVKLLIPFLFEAHEELAPLRQVASDRLIQIAQSDPELRGLSAIVDQIGAGRELQSARQASLPFLTMLPSPEAAKALTGETKERYLTLLTRRALARVADDPQRALRELDEVLTGRGWLTVASISKASREVFLARARALLSVKPKQPKDAFQIAAACLKEEADPATWGVALDALEALPLGETPPLLDLLAAPVEQAPDAIKERYARLRRGLPPKSSAPEGATPTPPATPGSSGS